MGPHNTFVGGLKWRNQHCSCDFPSPKNNCNESRPSRSASTTYFHLSHGFKKNPKILPGHPEPGFFTPSDGFPPSDDKGIMYGQSCLKGDGGDIIIAWSVLGIQTNCRNIPQSQRLDSCVCWETVQYISCFSCKYFSKSTTKTLTVCKSWHRSVCTQSTLAGPSGSKCFLGRWHQACSHFFLSFRLV